MSNLSVQFIILPKGPMIWLLPLCVLFFCTLFPFVLWKNYVLCFLERKREKVDWYNCTWFCVVVPCYTERLTTNTGIQTHIFYRRKGPNHTMWHENAEKSYMYWDQVLALKPNKVYALRSFTIEAKEGISGGSHFLLNFKVIVQGHLLHPCHQAFVCIHCSDRSHIIVMQKNFTQNE